MPRIMEERSKAVSKETPLIRNNGRLIQLKIRSVQKKRQQPCTEFPRLLSFILPLKETESALQSTLKEGHGDALDVD